MTITAEHVKALRDKTGAGMMECKKALVQSQGDLDGAVEWLRKQGLASAAKKLGRVAAEGMISCYTVDETLVAMAEINCETDFVVKTPDFQQFATAVAQLVGTTAPKDMDTLLASRLPVGTVADAQTGLVAKIGEKIQVRRFAVRQRTGTNQRLGWYIHAGNKIGVIVTFDDPTGKLSSAVAKDIAMHVAAMHPQYLRRDAVPADVLAKEQEIQRAQIASEKKPPEIIEKIITGRLEKFLAEICLDEQIFVKDPEGKRSVAQILKAIDPTIRATDMVRFQVGEGTK